MDVSVTSLTNSTAAHTVHILKICFSGLNILNRWLKEGKAHSITWPKPQTKHLPCARGGLYPKEGHLGLKTSMMT